MDDIFTDDEILQIAFPSDDAPAVADTAIDLLLLNPARVRLFRTGGDAVRATITDLRIGSARSYLRVQIARAYPLSQPDQFIGFRDDKDRDIGMLENLTGLDDTSRKIIAEELDRRYFLPRITRVRKIVEEFGTITVDVETDRGDRTFYIQNLRESTLDLPPHRLLISDRDGTRWEIPDTRRLDPRSRMVLQRVL